MLNQYIPPTPAAALKRLEEGNERFVQGLKSIQSLATESKREQLAKEGQRPYAIILGCADSRAPAELIFDAGLGDLFVVRVAGNIVTPGLLGSIEFAALNFQSPLIVVLGHTSCGAVMATNNLVAAKKRAPTDHIQDIVLELEPAVKKARAAMPTDMDLTQVEHATRLNVQHSANKLVERSKVLADLVESGTLRIAGGIYNLHTGRVDFLDLA
jgi:carbonic anhydrase